MTKQRYFYADQADFRGGINTEPENAGPNHVLDARNVWCPEGRIEQRPGFWGVMPLPVGTGGIAMSNAIGIGEDVSAGTFDDSVVELDLSYYDAETTAQAGDRVYIGYTTLVVATNGFVLSGLSINVDSANSNNIHARVEYYNGEAWLPLKVYTNDNATRETIIRPLFSDTGYNNLRFIAPRDWALTTIDSYERYFVRLTLVANDESGGGDTRMSGAALGDGTVIIDIGGPFRIERVGLSDYRMRGMFSFEFPSTKRYVLVTQRDRNTPTAFYFNMDGLPPNSYITDTVTVAADEPASATAIPQFEEGYVAYNHVITVHKAYPAADDDLIARVEDRDEFVGTINDIKSIYHPDYILQDSVFPAAKYIDFFHGQLWAANMRGRPYEVRWSAPQPAYKVWPGESNELLMEDDNSPITGMRAFGEHLAVFKQDSIWRMVFSGQSGVTGLNTYVPVKVPGGIGTVSNASIVDINGILMFLSEDGVYAFNGAGKPQKLSDPIDDIVDRISPGRRRFASAVHWRTQNCYLLSVALDGNDENNTVLVYDYAHGAWWVWDSIKVDAWLKDEGPYDEERIFFNGSLGGEIFRLDDGDTDNGTAIESYFTTHRVGYGDYSTKHLRRVRVNAESTDLTSLDVIVQREDEDTASQTTGTLDYTDSNESKVATTTLVATDTLVHGTKRRERRVGFRKTGDWFTVKILNDEKNKPMKINRLSVGLKPGGRR